MRPLHGRSAKGSCKEGQRRGSWKLPGNRRLGSSAEQQGFAGVDQLEVWQEQHNSQARPLSFYLEEEPRLGTPGHTWSLLGPARGGWGSERAPPPWQGGRGEGPEDHWGLDCPTGCRRLLSPGRAPNFGGR